MYDEAHPRMLVSPEVHWGHRPKLWIPEYLFLGTKIGMLSFSVWSNRCSFGWLLGSKLGRCCMSSLEHLFWPLMLVSNYVGLLSKLASQGILFPATLEYLVFPPLIYSARIVVNSCFVFLKGSRRWSSWLIGGCVVREESLNGLNLSRVDKKRTHTF